MSMAPSGEAVPPPLNISLAVVLSVDGIAEQLARQLSVTHVGYLARTHPTISSNLPNSVWEASVKATGAAERSRLLFVASLAGDAKKLRLLCSSPVEATTIDYRDRASGKSCVWAAAEGGHLAAVRLLADEGASFKSNRCQPYGRTPLWAAAAMGHTSVVCELADRGAQLDSPDRDGQTAAFIAAQRGYPEVVRELANRGANLNKQNWEGFTPLGSAAAGGGRLQVVSEIADSTTRAGLDGWIKSNPIPIVAQGHLSVVRDLCARGVDLDTPDRNQHTPLFTAAAGGHEEVVAILVESKADLNWRDLQGHSPLFAAAERGHMHVVLQLMRHGASLNQADFHNRTPMWIAAARGRTEIVRELVERGGELDTVDSDGYTAISIAAHLGSCETDLVRKGEYVEVQNLLRAAGESVLLSGMSCIVLNGSSSCGDCPDGGAQVSKQEKASSEAGYSQVNQELRKLHADTTARRQRESSSEIGLITTTADDKSGNSNGIESLDSVNSPLTLPCSGQTAFQVQPDVVQCVGHGLRGSCLQCVAVTAVQLPSTLYAQYLRAFEDVGKLAKPSGGEVEAIVEATSRSSKVSGRNLVAGEIHFAAFLSMCHTVCQSERDTLERAPSRNLLKFLDLGSGLGRAVIAWALYVIAHPPCGDRACTKLATETTDTVISVGVEIRSLVHSQVERQVLPKLSNEIRRRVSFVNCDMFNMRWGDADVVLVNATGLGREIFDRIAEKLATELTSGARIMSISLPMPESQKFRTIAPARLFRMTWGNCIVHFHEKV